MCCEDGEDDDLEKKKKKEEDEEQQRRNVTYTIIHMISVRTRRDCKDDEIDLDNYFDPLDTHIYKCSDGESDGKFNIWNDDYTNEGDEKTSDDESSKYYNKGIKILPLYIMVKKSHFDLNGLRKIVHSINKSDIDKYIKKLEDSLIMKEAVRSAVNYGDHSTYRLKSLQPYLTTSNNRFRNKNQRDCDHVQRENRLFDNLRDDKEYSEYCKKIKSHKKKMKEMREKFTGKTEEDLEVDIEEDSREDMEEEE